VDLAFLDRHRSLSPGPRGLEVPEAVIWVIEYVGTPHCWIADIDGSPHAFDVTFQSSLAQRFASREAAQRDIRRLALSPEWVAREIRGEMKVKGETP
jgi:hypothetical protein